MTTYGITHAVYWLRTLGDKIRHKVFMYCIAITFEKK